MKDYVRTLRQHFGSSGKFARFLGVSIHTLHSWQFGRRTPRGVELRLLETLGLLLVHEPDLFQAITKPAARSRVLPHLPYIPTMQKSQPTKPVSSWDDSYWYVRTVADPAEDPEIEHTPDMFKGWSEAQIDKYWDSCGSYERRTKRIYLN